jgi:hypothetical protein
MLRSCLGRRVKIIVAGNVTWQSLDRGFLLERIAEVARTLADMGGEQAAMLVVDAIRDTAAWWP